jgi:hypothetical protein
MTACRYGTNIGTHEIRARRSENPRSQDWRQPGEFGRQSQGNVRDNEIWPSGNEIRSWCHQSEVGCHVSRRIEWPKWDDFQPRGDGGQSTEDWAWSRNDAVRMGIKKSRRRKPEWCRSEDRESGVGTEIWQLGAGRSRKEGSRLVVNRGRDWLSATGRCPVVQQWYGAWETSPGRN